MTDLGNQSKNNYIFFAFWKSPPDYDCLRYTVLVSQDGDRSLWQWQIMTIYSGGDDLTIRLWDNNRKISLHMVVRRIARCWWIITAFLVSNELWKYKVAYLLRPSKGPPLSPPFPPLSHVAIRSTNSWVALMHFTDDLCTGHLNFRIIKWNNLRLAKMPIRLLTV